MAGFGQSRARAERLVTLATILRQGRPVTLTQLRDRYGLYLGDETASRRSFERDKEELRASGVDIVSVVLSESAVGYAIAKARTTTVRWSAAELDTLAVLTTAIGDDVGGIALAKLHATSREFPAEDASAQITLDVTVPPAIADAISQGRQLHLDYRNAKDELSSRTIEPWDLRYRKGLLYVTAWDPDADLEKHFRIDRIVGEPTIGDPATSERPDGPLSPVYEEHTFTFEMDVPAALRHDVVTADGTVIGQDGDVLHVRFDDARPDPVLGWAMRTGSTVTSPTEAVVEQQRRRDRLREVHTGEPSAVQVPAARRVRRATLTGERLQRLLLLPTWLGERAGVTRQEIATQFNCSVEEIDEDLGLLELIDLPGGGGSLGEVREHDGQIEFVRWLEEPSVDLTSSDALRLLLAVQIARTVLPEDEAPALEAIADRLREFAPAEVEVELSGQGHPDLEALKQAITEGATVRFQYRGRKDQEWRQRELRPEKLQVANGALYVAGMDVMAGGERMFRLDRLSDVETSGTLPALAAESPAPTYVPTAEEQEVVILLSTRATWLLTHLSPVTAEARDDGSIVAVVRTDTTEWLLAHIRSASGEAEIISPAAMRSAIAAS